MNILAKKSSKTYTEMEMLEKENFKVAEQRRGERLENVKTKKEETSDVTRSRNLQIGFWNIAGIGKKHAQFWDYMKGYDFIGLVETWLEEQDWNKFEKTLPTEFKWKVVPARREHKKGRAKGGIVTGVKKHLLEEDSNIETEHAQERTIKVQGKIIRILTVYSRAEGGNIWDIIREKYREEKDAVIIGGDFNVRIGEKGTNWGEDRKRKSKDKKLNKGGREFLKVVREKNWSILNGATDGDEDGNFTFRGASGSSVVDYAVANSLALEEVERFGVEDRTESDHMPIKIILKLKTEGGEWEKERNAYEDKKNDAMNEAYNELVKGIEKL